MDLEITSKPADIDLQIAGCKVPVNQVKLHNFASDEEDTLYQYLDIEMLISKFSHRLYRRFFISKSEFSLPDLEIAVDLSRQYGYRQKSCDQMHYDLYHGSKSLGTLVLFRSPDFSAFEKKAIGSYVNSLCGPLHNAILYAHACRSGYRDELTGLYNRAAIEALLFDKSIRSDRTITAVLVCDMDRFKWINDQYGHIVGDEVLAEFSARLSSIVGNDGSVFRYGGDEFVIALDSVTYDKSAQLAEKIRTETMPGLLRDNTPVTTTIGATMVQKGECLKTTFSRADTALFIGKTAGSNRVTWHEKVLTEVSN